MCSGRGRYHSCYSPWVEASHQARPESKGSTDWWKKLQKRYSHFCRLPHDPAPGLRSGSTSQLKGILQVACPEPALHPRQLEGPSYATSQGQLALSTHGGWRLGKEGTSKGKKDRRLRRMPRSCPAGSPARRECSLNASWIRSSSFISQEPKYMHWIVVMLQKCALSLTQLM